MTDKSHHLKRSQEFIQSVGCAAPCADYSLILVFIYFLGTGRFPKRNADEGT